MLPIALLQIQTSGRVLYVTYFTFTFPFLFAPMRTGGRVRGDENWFLDGDFEMESEEWSGRAVRYLDDRPDPILELEPWIGQNSGVFPFYCDTPPRNGVAQRGHFLPPINVCIEKLPNAMNGIISSVFVPFDI